MKELDEVELLAGMRSIAVAAGELFRQLMLEGFNRKEALRLIDAWIGSIGVAPPSSE